MVARGRVQYTMLSKHSDRIEIGDSAATLSYESSCEASSADYDDLRLLIITALKLEAGRRSRMHRRQMEYLLEMVRISFFISEHVTHRMYHVGLRLRYLLRLR